jgi:hypothetical protein
MSMGDAVTAYVEARASARWAMTLRLRWQERRAREKALERRLDQRGLARLTAVRDELRARGEDVPPFHRERR